MTETTNSEIGRGFNNVAAAIGLLIAAKALELVTKSASPEVDLLPHGNFERRAFKIVRLLAAMGDEQSKARLEANRFYESRIEAIRTRLWTTLSWMATADGAALVLVFKEGGLQTKPGPVLAIGQPLLVVALAMFVIMTSRFLRSARQGGVMHIRSNMRLANQVLGLEPGGQPIESVFDAFRWLSFGALLAGGLLLIFGFLGIAKLVTGWQIPYVVV